MAWLYLLIAGVFEVGWPLGMKLSQRAGWLLPGLLVAAACMAISGVFLWLAQRTIPIGTAYAIWTGIGTVGTLLAGIALFGESAAAFRLASAGLIVIGIVGLKMSH